ncbi:hypothetical protein GCM10011491_44680 [Brucella endophytica]|uniref:Uncharacterized protein n=1 Tax=Brucella endophytica TaxID=1963359 RepID=A0A916WME5_9HYPH|nr:hypothetical protein GCM10011491_44680 [Brucella endophytica]
MQVGDLLEIGFQHRAVAIDPERPAIMMDRVMDKPAKICSVPPVEAGDVVAIDRFKIEGFYPCSIWPVPS